ncbi:GGDEF domain-containing protein [Haliea sp. E17]|uniref:GGDEF domain-containing protein n=1 Tax=Haliea sp. E17 TaxID=3401576 RepID=UPI003AAF04EE
MIYQRHIPREELFSAQLEMLMQNGQLPTVAAHLIGVGAAMVMFWPFMETSTVLLSAGAFLVLLLLRSLHMSRALASRAYRDHPGWVYCWLLLGSAATGLAWAGVYILAAHHVPITMQYTFLLMILMITAVSVGFSVIIREYFIVFLFTAVWPIAWWSLYRFWEQPYNLVIGLSLLAFCALLVVICNRAYSFFCNMISLGWERESMSRELGQLTTSLRDRNRQLRSARAQLTDLANIDELTGLANRRRVNVALQEELERACESRSNLSLIMLDVDFFKPYNDTYGHPAGDQVLKQLAEIMLGVTGRAGELVARYGGEEFILLLPGASSEAALRTAERLRLLVEAAAIPHGAGGAGQRITVSQGVVTVLPEDHTRMEHLLTQADEALYSAKQRGRNQVIAAA